jgi:phosphate uptake regulator
MAKTLEELSMEKFWERVAERTKTNPITVKVDINEDIKKMQNDTLSMLDKIIEGLNALNDLIEKGDKS